MRYSRNLQLDGFDESSQERIRQAKVAIVGAGALGQVAAMYLAGSGVGHLRIADFDTIDLSNLQRQVFFSEEEVGQRKVEVLASRIKALNSDVSVDMFGGLVTRRNAGEFLEGCDVVAECSDNPSTKRFVVEEAAKAGIPVVTGGVREFTGQLAVFRPDSPVYTDIFPEPECSGILPCSLSGVFGPVPGIVGCMQASEILKLLTGIGATMEHTLLTFDLRDMNFRKFTF